MSGHNIADPEAVQHMANRGDAYQTNHDAIALALTGSIFGIACQPNRRRLQFLVGLVHKSPDSLSPAAAIGYGNRSICDLIAGAIDA
jgi:hypothetical protein